MIRSSRLRATGCARSPAAAANSMTWIARPMTAQRVLAATHGWRYSQRGVRAAWIALMVLAVGVFAAGMPARLAELRQQFQRHIGFDFVQNTAGEIVVSPWSGGPAARAG